MYYFQGFPLLISLLTLSCVASLPAQEVQLEMSSTLQLSPQRDDMALPEESGSCATYLFEGERFFDAPDRLEVYDRTKYIGGFEFVAFLRGREIGAEQLDDLGYQFKAGSTGESFEVNGEKLQFKGNTGYFLLIPRAPDNRFAPLQIQLQDRGGKTLAQSEFSIRVLPEPQPGDPITVDMPYKIKRLDTWLTVQHFADKNKPRKLHFEERQPLHIRLEEGQDYMLMVEMYKEVDINSKTARLAIDPKQNYSHRVTYRWEGKALPLKLRLDNGLVAYLSAEPPAPGKTDVRQIERSEAVPREKQQEIRIEQPEDEKLKREQIRKRNQQIKIQRQARVQVLEESPNAASSRIQEMNETFTLHLDLHDELGALFDTKTIVFEVSPSGRK